MEISETVDRLSGACRNSFLLQVSLLTASTALLFAIAGRERRAWEPVQDDQLLVADFVDGTGDGTLAQGLKQILILALKESPHFRVFSESRLRRILRGMGHDSGVPVTPGIAAAICKKERIPFLLVPYLVRTGDSYLMTMQLTMARDGTSQRISLDNLKAHSKTELVCSLDHVAAVIRKAMGENDQSLQATGPILSQQATTDTEALILFTQALALGVKANFEGESSILQHTVTLNPRLVLAQLKLGELWLRLGRKESAIGPLLQAAQDAKSLPLKERHHALGLSLVLSQEYERARQQYQMLAEKFPSDPEVQIRAAETLVLAYDFVSAQGGFERAIRLDDSSIEGYLGLCMAHLYAGSTEAARKAWEVACALEPENPRVLSIGGFIDLVNNDLGAALKLFRRVAESPSTLSRSQGLFLEAEAQIYSGRFQSALTTLADGIAADSSRDDADSEASKRLARAGVYLLLGDRSAAIAECDRVPRISSRAEQLGRLGTVYAQAGRVEQARDLLRGMDKLPGSSWVRYQAAILRGEIELAGGHSETAVPLLLQAKELSPDHGPLEPLARALAKAQRYDQAQKEYALICDRKAVMLLPPRGGWFMGTWSNALFENARCLSSLGKASEAFQYYRSYLWVLDGADPGLPSVQQARDELKKGSSRNGIR